MLCLWYLISYCLFWVHREGWLLFIIWCLWQIPGRNMPLRLPAEVNDAWLNTLTLVKPPEDTLHFKGRQLHSFIKSVKIKLLQGEAAEEYKVQNGCHCPEDILKWIFLNENVQISINISLKIIPKGPIDNISALVQIMGWRLNQWWLSLQTHICISRPQWVNSFAVNFQYQFDICIEIQETLRCKVPEL